MFCVYGSVWSISLTFSYHLLFWLLIGTPQHERRRHSKAEQCSCPNPSVALAGTGTNAVHWTSYHNQLVKAAKDAPKNLDVVFVGDDIVERWQGTTELGTKILGADMERPFQSRFVKKKGGHLEGLALGASSDTVSEEEFLCVSISPVSFALFLLVLTVDLPFVTFFLSRVPTCYGIFKME